jgi:hypothetical protein
MQKEFNLNQRLHVLIAAFQKKKKMPEDSCQFFYECENCKTILKPLEGDCCVFCSYGSVPCPPVRANEKYYK